MTIPVNWRFRVFRIYWELASGDSPVYGKGGELPFSVERSWVSHSQKEFLTLNNIRGTLRAIGLLNEGFQILPCDKVSILQNDSSCSFLRREPEPHTFIFITLVINSTVISPRIINLYLPLIGHKSMWSHSDRCCLSRCLNDEIGYFFFFEKDGPGIYYLWEHTFIAASNSIISKRIISVEFTQHPFLWCSSARICHWACFSSFVA